MTPPNALDTEREAEARAYNGVSCFLVQDLLREIDRLRQHALASEAAAYELFQVAKNFVAWADDCWGGWAINDEETPKAKAEYLAAKEAITKFEEKKP